jgi:hypothetical protein
VVEKNHMSYRERKGRNSWQSLVRDKREEEATFIGTMLKMGFVLELSISRMMCIFIVSLHSNVRTPSLKMR